MQVNHFDKPVQEIETFKDQNKYKWFVTKDFFEQKEKPDLSLPITDLIIKHHIIKYTHNPLGPSAVLLKKNEKTKEYEVKYESYWLNGLPAKKEEVERLKYNAEFHDHVEKVLND